MAGAKSIGLAKRLWIVALAVLALGAGFYFARRSGSDYTSYSNDFNVYYFAAREIIAGRDPYTNSLGPSTTYLYPPLLAQALATLALLPLPVAAYLWFLVSAASLAAAAAMSAKLATDQMASRIEHPDMPQSDSIRPGLVAILAVAVLIRFALDTFDTGQVNAILVALSVAHVYLFARGRKAGSALALAVATAIKLSPALLILYHLSRGRIKFAALCSVVIAAVMFGSFAALGRGAGGSAQVFYGRTIQNKQGFDLAYAGNQSLRGAAGRLINESGESARSPFSLVSFVASTVLLLIAILASRFSGSEIAAAAPFFSCMVLISPLAWKNHYLTLLFPIAVLAGIIAAPGQGRPQRRLSLCALMLSFVLLNLTSPRVIGLYVAEWADAHSLVTVGALAVFAATAYIQGRIRNRTVSSGGERELERRRRT
jgi:alpha-1,2-mannosyltransferase